MMNWLNTRFFGFLVCSVALSLGLSVTAAPKTQISLKSLFASDWENARLLQKLETATTVNLLKFSPDGKLLAGVHGNQISIWGLEQLEVIRVLPGHHSSEINLTMVPTAIAFSPDSQFLATASWSQGYWNPDQTILVREITSGEEIFSIQVPSGCRQVRFAPSGNTLYGACEQGVTAWSFPEGREVFKFDTKFPVEQLALSSDGQVMATANANISGRERGEQSSQIKLWQLNQGKPELLGNLEGHMNNIAQLEFTSNGRHLVSSSYDGEIKVWNWRQRQILPSSQGLSSRDGVFSISADAQLIAGNFHSSHLTELVSGLPLRNAHLPGSSQTSRIVAFSPQGSLLALVENPSESNNKTNQAITLWQPQSALSEVPLKSLQETYRSLKLSDHWQNHPTSSADETTTRPYAIGADPGAIAMAAFGAMEKSGKLDVSAINHSKIELDERQINDNLTLVTLTQNNVSDDSVAALRYLIKFAPYDDADQEQWQVVWAGEQFRCLPGRGQQTWGADLCH